MKPPVYQVRFSKRKTLALEITREGILLVRAPAGTPECAIEKVLTAHSEWINKALKKQTERRLNHPEPTEEELSALIKRAKETLPPKVEYYARLMGVTPTRLTITRARTRFGSCSGKNAISFSCYLLAYPEEAIDYVVVHELSHIRHHDHSPAFWREVETYLPDYRERKKLLKQ